MELQEVKVGDLITTGVLILGVIGAFLYATIASNRRDKWRKERLAKGHEWIPLSPGEPREEGGKCKWCGAWANSEENTPCWID
jgi:hypothetical protein